MITCRILDSSDVGLYGTFMKARGADCLALFFGAPVKDSVIDQLVDKISSHPSEHAIIVAEDENLEIVGTIHVAKIDDVRVEFGIMVSEKHRRKKIADTLVDFAFTYCRNRGLTEVYMYCMNHNIPVMNLIKKKGLFISNQSGDADAKITLPDCNPYTFLMESWTRNSDFLNRIRNQQIVTFHRALSVINN
jgi:GNAT superfamily N-acetyltransferase